MKRDHAPEGLLTSRDAILFEGKIGLLCNQISFSPKEGKYLFEIFAQRGILKTMFVTEHGLFAELQDQIPLDSVTDYQQILPQTNFRSLYQSEKATSLRVQKEDLVELDAVIVDLQDVGSRYYTYLSTLKYLLDTIAENRLTIKVILIDRPNPAGRQVEGSMMPGIYASFIGLAKLPHRYGLTVGEMALYFNHLLLYNKIASP